MSCSSFLRREHVQTLFRRGEVTRIVRILRRHLRCSGRTALLDLPFKSGSTVCQLAVLLPTNYIAVRPDAMKTHPTSLSSYGIRLTTN